MENVNGQNIVQEQVCKCGAHVKGNVAYCPHCGKLLSEANVSVIPKSDYDRLKTTFETLTKEKQNVEKDLSIIRSNGYAPNGSRILKNEEYDRLEQRIKNAEEGKNRALSETNTALNNLRTVQLQHTRSNKKFNTLLCVLLATVLTFGGIFAYQYFNVDNDVETISATNDVLSRLPGNYTLRETRNGEPLGTSKTAVLRKETSGYTFTIVTDYGPEHHRFIITSNNLLHSETLGDGEVTYKDAINKITITFKKDNFSWEFVK